MQLLIMKADHPPHYKGDFVEVRASGSPFGGKEPEAFVLVEVPGVPMTDYEQYRRSWYCEVDFEVVNQDLAQDGFRLRMYATNNNGSLGAVTRADVEAFINSWGGTVHSFGANEVVFDICIFDALTSAAFWEINVSGVQFIETAYDQDTGIHRIEADYSAIGNNPTYVERRVAEMGLTVISHDNRVLTYDADRAVVRQNFERDLAEKSRRLIARRRYHVSETIVDYIIGQGGMVSTDLPTLAGYIQDKTTA